MNNNKNLLITGGLGGIGLEIVKLFYKKKYNIIILDNKKISFFNNLNTNTSNNNFIKYIKIDLTKPAAILSAITSLSAPIAEPVIGPTTNVTVPAPMVVMLLGSSYPKEIATSAPKLKDNITPNNKENTPALPEDLKSLKLAP